MVNMLYCYWSGDAMQLSKILIVADGEIIASKISSPDSFCGTEQALILIFWSRLWQSDA